VPAAPASLPSAEVETLEGAPAEVVRAAQGRVALVNLWATWCDACLDELDALNRLDATVAPARAAVVIGVAVGERRETVAAFARRRGLRYLQLVDAEFRFADAVGQRSVPATLVVDRDGRIVYRSSALDAGTLDALRRAMARQEARATP
jgi:thiol-disulfide isomerase/thioredoxin